MQSPVDIFYEDLANAIITQAARDYSNALRGKSYCYKSPEKVIKEIERFFRSEYFTILTKVKGKYLIERLKQEYLEEIERSNDESNTDTSNT